MADVEMAEASVPGEEEVVAPKKVITQAFSAELLSLYYSRLFPYDEMYRWLSYGNNLTDKSATGTTVGNPEYFYHREISFTLEDDIYIRYLNFRNASEFRKEITKKQPHKIDIGAVYSHPPSMHTMYTGNMFKPLERELVFDIDLTDYDDVGAAGADIRANFSPDERAAGVVLAAGARALIPTGLRMEIPQGYEVQLRPRSGLALKHGITLLNSPGTIDSDYRGTVGVILFNASDQNFHIAHGDRIAQMVVAPITQAAFELSDGLSITQRGTGGFGSTGQG